MSRYIKTIIILGLTISIFPFLGFPNSVKNIFFIIAGITLSILAYFAGRFDLGRNEKSEEYKHDEQKVFSENKDDFIKDNSADMDMQADDTEEGVEEFAGSETEQKE